MRYLLAVVPVALCFAVISLIFHLAGLATAVTIP